MDSEMLREIAEDLWCIERVVKLAGVAFPARMCVIRLADGTVLLHSPLPIDDAIAGEIAAIGPVRHVVAPNAFHHLFLTAAAARYSDATVYATRALAKKKPRLALDVIVADDAPAGWRPALEAHVVAGLPRVDELVLFHPASRTLIVTDFILHVTESPSWLTRLFLKMFNAYGRPAQSRLLRWLTRDRTAARASVDRMLAWDFDRLVMAHGPLIETGGAAVLVDATSWLGATTAALPPRRS